MMATSLVTITPDPSEFCTSSSSRGLRNRRWFGKKNSTGSTPYSRRIATLVDVFTATTDGTTLLTSARRSPFKDSSDATCFGLTTGSEANVYFYGVRPDAQLKLSSLRRQSESDDSHALNSTQ